MKHAEDWQRELETLLAAAECGELGADQRQRLNELLLAEEAALEATVDQLEVEALLRWRHDAIEGQPSQAVAPIVKRWPLLALSLAAAVLIALGVWWWSDRNTAPPEPQVALVDTWQIEATGKASYELLSPRRVRLTRGELLVRSVRTPAGTLSIETPDGNEARASGTFFFIGTHTSSREGLPMETKLTRGLVHPAILGFCQ